MLPLILAAAISALLLFRRWYLCRPRHGRDGSPLPPRMPDWLPFIGNAFSLTEGDPFWDKSLRKYGPAVNILAMGTERTYVSTAPLINLIYKRTQAFDFWFFRKSYQVTAFGMERKSSFSPAMNDQLFPSHHKAMQPGAIVDAIHRYANSLEEELGALLAGLDDQGREVDLESTVFSIIYTASTKAFFSPSFPAAKTLQPFKAFDKIISLLFLGTLPRMVLRPMLGVRDKLLDLMEEWYRHATKNDLENMSAACKVMMEIHADEGWSERDAVTLLLAELWALSANAPYAGIWTILEVMRRPALLEQLRKEVDSAVSRLEPPELSTLLRLTQPEIVAALPTINACFQETLRYHTSSFSLRRVVKEVLLPMSTDEGQRDILLPKGSEVVCVGRPSQISKADWGADADVWDHTRWLDKERPKGSVYSFGGGVSMCEGRHFASAEILTFVAAWISMTDVEIVEGKDTLRPDLQRVGLGVFQPKGSTPVRLRRRQRPV